MSSQNATARDLCFLTQHRPNARTSFTRADVWNERQVLVGVVLDNRRSILSLKQIEEDREHGNYNEQGDDWQEGSIVTTDKPQQEKEKKGRFDPIFDTRNRGMIDIKSGNSEITADEWEPFDWGIIQRTSSRKKKGKKGKDSKKKERKEKINFDPDIIYSSPTQPRSASRARYVEDYEVSEPGPAASGSKPMAINISPDRVQINGSHKSSSTSERQNASLSQSPASGSFSIAPEFPISTSDTENDHPRRSSTPQRKASGEGLAVENDKSQESPPELDIVTPTAKWFLTVVPHEPDITALIVRPPHGHINHLRARAEETAKTLLLDWTNIDPDSISGNESEDLKYAENFNSYNHGPARAQQIAAPPYQTPYPSQAYQGYAPQQWYQPSVYTLPPSAVPSKTLPPPTNKIQTDSEELARLKRLILDEKAEQDRRAAELAASTPPRPPFAPEVPEELLEDTMQAESADIETLNSVQASSKHNSSRRADPPRPQPVILRDCLGRKFVFPVDACQTWEVCNP